MKQQHLAKPFQTHAAYPISAHQQTPVSVGSFSHNLPLHAPPSSACGVGSGAGASCGEGRSSSSTSSIVSVPALASVGSPTRPDSQSDYHAQHRLSQSPVMRDDYGLVLRSTKSVPVPTPGPPSVSSGFAQSRSPVSHVSLFCHSTVPGINLKSVNLAVFYLLLTHYSFLKYVRDHELSWLSSPLFSFL